MKLRITVDGHTYEVEVEVAAESGTQENEGNDPASATTAIQSAVLRSPPKPGLPGEPGANELKLSRSPVAGIVIRVHVRAGQELQVNDAMIVLEAMKMESLVTAPMSGIVKSVNVTPGEAVKPGQILLEFE